LFAIWHLSVSLPHRSVLYESATLCAIVERAQENIAEAGKEFISLVPKRFARLYNGKGVGRVKQIVHIPAPPGDISPSFAALDLKTWTPEEGYSPKEAGEVEASPGKNIWSATKGR
jgi:hypothetical protein